MAHSRRLRKKDFEDALNIIKEVKRAFTDCLEEIDSVKLSEKESERVQEVAKTTVANLKSYDYLSFENNNLLDFDLAKINKTLDLYKPYLDEINTHNSYYSDLFKNIYSRYFDKAIIDTGSSKQEKLITKEDSDDCDKKN